MNPIQVLCCPRVYPREIYRIQKFRQFSFYTLFLHTRLCTSRPPGHHAAQLPPVCSGIKAVQGAARVTLGNYVLCIFRVTFLSCFFVSPDTSPCLSPRRTSWCPARPCPGSCSLSRTGSAPTPSHSPPAGSSSWVPQNILCPNLKSVFKIYILLCNSSLSITNDKGPGVGEVSRVVRKTDGPDGLGEGGGPV